MTVERDRNYVEDYVSLLAKRFKLPRDLIKEAGFVNTYAGFPSNSNGKTAYASFMTHIARLRATNIFLVEATRKHYRVRERTTPTVDFYVIAYSGDPPSVLDLAEEVSKRVRRENRVSIKPRKEHSLTLEARLREEIVRAQAI